MLEGEPKTIIATLYGIGLECNLILRLPNNKNIENIKEIKYYGKLEEYKYKKISDDTLIELNMLKKEIEEYCMYYDFYTYESKAALVLEIYDNSDRVKFMENCRKVVNRYEQ